MLPEREKCVMKGRLTKTMEISRVTLKTFFFYFLVLGILDWCVGYTVEVTVNDNGTGKYISEFEIVDHDNPPFENDNEEQFYKDETTSYFEGRYIHSDDESNTSVPLTSESRKHTDKMKQDGVKVSGFLGNIRSKRSLDKINNECMKPSGDSSTSNQAVTVETDETIHLPCHSCLEDEKEMFESMEWVKLYQYPNSKGLYHLKEVLPDEHDDEKLNRVSVTLDHTLVIKNAKLSDAGSYFCKPSEKTGSFMNLRLDWSELQEYITTESHMKYYFHVDVIDLNQHDIVDVSSYSNTQPIRPEVVSGLNIELTTKWHPWTSCSVCGDDGIRKRMGLCLIRRHDSSRPVPDIYLRNILNFSKGGLPCLSQFLREFWQEPWMQRPNQIQIEECNVPCKTTNSNRQKRKINIISRSHLTDENIKEVMMKKKYAKKKGRKKKIKMGSYFILKCKGVSITKTANWVNGSKLIHLIKIKKLTNSRISADMFGNLHFKKAELTDSGTYSCWVKKKMKKKYEVRVEQDKHIEIKKYTVYLCLSFLVDFLVFIALAIIKYLQRKVQHRRREEVKDTAEESEEESGGKDGETGGETDSEADGETSSSDSD